MLLARLFTRQTTRAIANVRYQSSLPLNEPSTDFTDPKVTAKVLEELHKVEDTEIEIPCVIGGEKIYTTSTVYQVLPYRHTNKIAKIHMADKSMIKKAIDCALAAREQWELTTQEERSAIFTKAADLVTTKYRFVLIAAIMAGQAKTPIQADVDGVGELADFLRFNCHYAKGILGNIDLIQTEGVKNTISARGLEGFIAAISPFNFTAIGCNLVTTAAIMGNVVLWKPAIATTRASWQFYQILEEAGLPKGVINFLPCPASTFGSTVTSSPHLAGLNFVGRGSTFKTLWKQVGENIDNFKTYPRLSGECSGKNFHFVHESANVETAVNATIRAAFDYCGQNCSSVGRMYVPDTLWPQIKEQLLEKHKEIKYGEPRDFSNFSSAVIDDKAWLFIKEYVDYAKSSSDVTILAGGKCDNSVGYFIEPTIVQTTNPHDKLFEEEILGPVLSIYVYPAKDYKETLKLVNETSPYGLTGAVFAKHSDVVEEAKIILRHAAGNFYVNDKATGAVAGQQPYGGSRASGTNDKPGSYLKVLRWTSPLTIKENASPILDWKYPYMKQ